MSACSRAGHTAIRWHALTLLALLHLPTETAADTISLGGADIYVPSPVGFYVVTPEMTGMYELQQQSVYPGNRVLRNFIGEEAVPAALSGGITDLEKWFSLQIVELMVNRSMTTSQFAEFKTYLKNNNAEIVRKVEKSIPGVMEKMNENIENIFGANPNFAIAQAIPFPAHHETDRTIAYSMVTKLDMTDASGNPATRTIVSTQTAVLVKGKVLTLYALADQSGLEWSRKACQQWSAALIQANPSRASLARDTSTASVSDQINWNEVFGKALAGAVVAALFGVSFWIWSLIKRSFSRPTVVCPNCGATVERTRSKCNCGFEFATK